MILKRDSRLETKRVNGISWERVIRVIFMIMAGLCVVLGGMQVFLSSKIATTGAQIRQLEEQKEEIEAQIGLAQERIARASSLPYIEKRAKDDLSMEYGVEKVHFLSPQYLATGE